jgi:hypothetical protein
MTLNAISKKRLKPLMTLVQQALNYIPDLEINEDPTLSIARSLTPHKLEQPKSLFKIIDIRLLCDSIVLKKFDKEIKQ